MQVSKVFTLAAIQQVTTRSAPTLHRIETQFFKTIDRMQSGTYFLAVETAESLQEADDGKSWWLSLGFSCTKRSSVPPTGEFTLSTKTISAACFVSIETSAFCTTTSRPRVTVVKKNPGINDIGSPKL
jgi:hypothetical protein